jgi:hypothetical protein
VVNWNIVAGTCRHGLDETPTVLLL